MADCAAGLPADATTAELPRSSHDIAPGAFAAAVDACTALHDAAFAAGRAAAGPVIAAEAARQERQRILAAIADHATTLQRPGMGKDRTECVEVVLIRDLADLLEGDAP